MFDQIQPQEVLQRVNQVGDDSPKSIQLIIDSLLKEKGIEHLLEQDEMNLRRLIDDCFDKIESKILRILFKNY